MSGRTRFSIAIAAVAAVAIAAVAAPRVDFGGDEDEAAEPPASSEPSAAPEPPGPARPQEPARRRPTDYRAPENPDEVKGTHPRALTRTANFRRALAVLERRRRAVEGVYDGLRVAPGRIDTTIETRKRRMTIQVRSDLTIGFETAHDFPNRPDYRRYGISARDVDVRGPASLLRRIDRARPGSAARDVDYIVIRRDIIDFKVNLTAFMRTGPRPRAFSAQPGEALRAIG